MHLWKYWSQEAVAPVIPTLRRQRKSNVCELKPSLAYKKWVLGQPALCLSWKTKQNKKYWKEGSLVNTCYSSKRKKAWISRALVNVGWSYAWRSTYNPRLRRRRQQSSNTKWLGSQSCHVSFDWKILPPCIYGGRWSKRSSAPAPSLHVDVHPQTCTCDLNPQE